MELSTIQQHSDVLLTGKNVLNESVLEKYRLAGQIAQTALKYVISLIHDSYHFQTISPPLLPSEICLLGDLYLQSSLSSQFQKTVSEKGIAQPVSLDVNEIAFGSSPEIAPKGGRNPLNVPFVPGDIVTISLATHVDGYTAQAAHTVVIYPPGQKPEGPLLGPKSDAGCAAYIASEAVVALLGCVLSPEKILGNQVLGTLLRSVVDRVAASFGCTVVPGSKIRRVRRFLAGQAENIVAEKDFKGVVWAEAHQEVALLKKLQKNTQELVKSGSVDHDKIGVSESSAIPTDAFVAVPGEVYNIDIRMAPVAQFEKPGFISVENSDEFSGKNHEKDAIVASLDVFVRDFAVEHTLRLKSARTLLSIAEKRSLVYPFKLSHLADGFPLKGGTIEEKRANIAEITTEINKLRLGLGECVNNHLIVQKKINIAKFVALEDVLKISNENARNPTQNNDLTLNYNSLPGFEIPLPKLGITHLKLQQLLKRAPKVVSARELCTVVLNGEKKELLRLTGGSKIFPASYMHSEYKLEDEEILGLVKLGQDTRFGVRVKECQPLKLA